MRIILRQGSFALLLGLGLTASVAPTTRVEAQAEEASSDESTEAARELFSRGLDAVDEEDWTAAEGFFRASLELRYSPVTAYNLASALAAEGRVVEPIELLQELLRQRPLRERLRVAASEMLSRLLPRVAHLTLSLNGPSEGVRVTIDERPVAERDIGHPIAVDPGMHRIQASGPRGEVVEGLALAEGEERDFAIQLQAAVPGPAEAANTVVDAPDSSRTRGEPVHRRAWFWPTLGGVVVVAILAAVLTTRDTSEDPAEGNFPPGVVTVSLP